MRLIEVIGTLNSRVQTVHTATTGVVLNHLVTRRILFAMVAASVFCMLDYVNRGIEVCNYFSGALLPIRN